MNRNEEEIVEKYVKLVVASKRLILSEMKYLRVSEPSDIIFFEKKRPKLIDHCHGSLIKATIDIKKRLDKSNQKVLFETLDLKIKNDLTVNGKPVEDTLSFMMCVFV